MTNEQRIYNQALKGSPVNPGLPASLALLLVAQAKHETGNFTSNFFRSYNNAFGYSYVPGGRYQLGAGSIADNGAPIARYASVEDSVKELVDWLNRRRIEGKFPAFGSVTTPEQYAALLKAAGYYGDTLENYSNGLIYYFKSLAGSLAAGAKQSIPVLALIALGAAGYFAYKKFVR